MRARACTHARTLKKIDSRDKISMSSDENEKSYKDQMVIDNKILHVETQVLGNYILDEETKLASSKFQVNMKLINHQKFRIDKILNSRCGICKQNLEDKYLRIYSGHPSNAVDEHIALMDEKLSPFSGNEANIIQNDSRATNKITLFNIYCKNGHLCPFDSGLIGKDTCIYISGYLKPIYCDDSSISNAVLTKDIGPIVEWFFTGSQKNMIVLSTPLGEYYLMEPSEVYSPFMILVKEKIFLSKIVIECLVNEPNTEYDELLNRFEITPMPHGLSRFTEDLLIYNAQFICDQIASFDKATALEEDLLIHSPCMKSLIDLARVTFKCSRKIKRYQYQQRDSDWKNKLRFNHENSYWTKAITTSQVYDLFESFFQEQREIYFNKFLLKRRKCGVCETCLETDDDEYSTYRNINKFNGARLSEQTSEKHHCRNIQNEDNNIGKYCNDYENNINENESNFKIHKNIITSLKKKKSTIITWLGEPILSSKGDFYKAVMINSEKIEINDYIFIEPIDSSVSMQVIKVRYLWETKLGTRMLHGTWLWRGTETILGETSFPRELFLVDECQDVPLTFVQAKANVVIPQLSEDINNMLKENDMLLFYRKRYDHITARFEDILPELEPPPEKQHYFCSTCVRDSLTRQCRIPQLFEKLLETEDNIKIKYGMIKYLNEEFRVGTTVYLKPKTFDFEYLKNDKETLQNSKHETIDEEKYPEFFRKVNDKVRNLNFDTPEPFDIGYITSIYSTSKSKLMACINLYITVKKLFRPENTHIDDSLKRKFDINILYWSDEECDVRFNCVIGKCYVTYLKNLHYNIEEWSTMGPDRFYFAESYDSKKKAFLEPSLQARKIGKIRAENNKIKQDSVNKAITYPQISKKLRILDVFSGCGGLAEGLKLSGVAESHWAIENNEAAAQTYRFNNLNALVFTMDCSTFLEHVMNGKMTLNGQKLPQKGDVDLLCGGPPRQEFSGFNHVNSRAYSSFKNSLLVTYISFCDYYKPRFFIMENVRNFILFKKSCVLKLTLSCLVRMGYQCTFRILQTGNYGIPQTERRMILLAAAPGEILPKFPKPLHVFRKSTCHSSVNINGVKYFTSTETCNSAPYRAINVYDAFSDLPIIRSGNNEVVMQYVKEPITHFQRKMRSNMGNEVLLYDHICKDLGPLAEARVGYVPTEIGSDWRDLPNITVRLSDGSYTNKLYNDKKSGISSNGALRGVCSCCEYEFCDPQDKQVNTLIPWYLPHTANQHNNWIGLYGRIEWHSFFSTTIINPNPLGKQGRVIHPEQTRVVSVRECARSQGFPDNFRFYGNIQDKHKQIGNALPPPLGAAIGYEIRKSISLKEAKVLYRSV